LRTILLLAFVVSAFSVTLEEAQESFKEFQAEHQVVYDSPEEYSLRFKIFLHNLQRVEKLNAEKTGAVYGVTKFSDLTEQEFADLYLSRPQEKASTDLPQADLNACAAKTRFGEEHCISAPTASDFDWTTKGAVTVVKDQGQCGSCWSFGTTGDLEGTWFLAGHNLISLSEQQLVSCDTVFNAGCNGGLQEAAFRYIIKIGGIQSEADYPYTSGNGRVPACDIQPARFVANMSAWAQVSSGASGEANMAPYLASNGPITIGINASNMQLYRSGIANPSNCNPNQLDHAVLIVGYGTENGVDYWKIKNSWGPAWGEKGYYRIVRGSNACGVAEDAVHSLV